ncbi:PGF-CTERM sorting domain-containing protein [Halorientalis brevis]|uniref:PGF-CTERM sorting domain-containing protein n=1 Tax=Halorientalis brevis TaxID=1126241 RepID=A0ABD6C601_9EURY|nr:PGF-CTERM sorting domain-containing protein [Halorientalis brevis]
MRRPAVLLAFAALAVAMTVGSAAGAATVPNGNETVLTAEIEGTTATNVTISPDADVDDIRATVAAELDVDEQTVRVAPEETAVEVREGNVSTTALRDALRTAGLNASAATVHDGVSAHTQTETVRIIDERLAGADIDATVASVTTDGGARGVRIRATDTDPAVIVENLTFQGRVEMVAHFPVQRDGDTVHRDVTLLTNEDFETVGSARSGRPGTTPLVPVTLTDEAAQNYSNAMQNFGFTSDEGIADCQTDTAKEDPDNASGHCLYTVYDGEVVSAAQMSAGLAQTFETGDFVNDPEFVITAANMSEARDLSLALRAGALPAPLDFDELPESPRQNNTAGSNTESTETQTATERSDADSTETVTATERSDAESSETVTATETTSSGDGPGFTAIAALAALLGLVVVGRRVESR